MVIKEHVILYDILTNFDLFSLVLADHPILCGSSANIDFIFNRSHSRSRYFTLFLVDIDFSFNRGYLKPHRFTWISRQYWFDFWPWLFETTSFMRDFSHIDRGYLKPCHSCVFSDNIDLICEHDRLKLRHFMWYFSQYWFNFDLVH